MYCFNTQPPEGGCAKCQEGKVRENLFQHTAARRRLPICCGKCLALTNVSTHSRPKAAAYFLVKNATLEKFQHTAARRRLRLAIDEHFGKLKMFQHTAARRRLPHQPRCIGSVRKVSTHSRPKAAASHLQTSLQSPHLFQHTAARRRLRY